MRPQVLAVAHSLDHEEATAAGHKGLGVGRSGSVGDGDHPAMEVESHDPGDQLSFGGEHRHPTGVEQLEVRGEPFDS